MKGRTDQPVFYNHSGIRVRAETARRVNGDVIEISDSGIVHKANGTNLTRSVWIERDDAGRITAIRDPNSGSNGLPVVKYVYNRETGNLIQVHRLQDRGAGNYVTTTYVYGNPKFPHYITEIVNPNGVPVARNNYDDAGRLISVQDADGNIHQYIHNLTNKLEVTIDRLGRTNTLAYDTRGNITATTNALGGITLSAYDDLNNKTNAVAFLNGQPYATNHFVYDPNGLLLSATDPLGHSGSVTYNQYGQVTSATNARNHSSTNVYDSAGNLIATTDPLGNSITNFYSNGLLVGSREADGTRTTNYFDGIGNLTASAAVSASGAILSTNSFAYDANGNRTNSTVWRRVNGSWTGATTTYIFDAQNRVVQTIGPDGGTNTVVYGATGKQTATIDKLGRMTTYEYAARGQLVRTTYPDGTTETSAYDSEGRRTNSVDRAGHVTTYVHDALGRVIETIFPDDTSARTIYDDLGRAQFNVDARGVTNAFAYDRAGRRVAVTNAWGTPASTFSLFGYDENGNHVTFTNALGVVTTNVFDALNRRVQVWFADGTKAFAGFDAAGRRVAETNQDGIITLFGFDGLAKLTSVTNAFGTGQQKVTRYEYDEVGNRSAQIDALNRTNTSEFDAMGRRTRHTLPGGQSETFGYDLLGNLIRHTNFNGTVITNQFDVMNRLTNRSSVNGYAISWAYAATGQRTNMVDPSGTTAYAYDLHDRLTNKVVAWDGGPTITLNYRHDANGNLTHLWSGTANGVTNFYQYDSLNRLTNVLANGNPAGGYGFDAVGNLQSVHYGNNVTNLYRHDTLNRLTNVLWKLNTTTLGDFTYKLGLAGNRTNLSETVNGTSRTYAWQFDPLYRLTNEVVSGAAPTGNLSYGYDPVGNRTNRSGSLGGLGTQSFTYSTNDWLAGDSYDNNGATTASGGNSYQYDVESRLTNVNSGAVLIAYNGDGARVRKTVGAVTTYFLVDDQNPSGYAQVLEEWTASGGATNLNRVYNYGLDLISQREGGGAVYYFGCDGHGSTRFLTDGNATMVNVFVYDAYGTLIASNGPPQTAYLYCGEQRDPDLGFYYQRERYLNPGTGRFWTSDPFEGFRSDPRSLHRYLFAANDPVNNIDPSGRLTLGEQVMYTAIATVVAGFTITSIASHTIGEAIVNGEGISGWLFSFRAAGGKGGWVAAGGIDFIRDNKTRTWWIGLTAEFGLSPLTHFNDFNVSKTGLKAISGSFMVGPVFNMDNPQQLGGLGFNATMPLRTAHLLGHAFKENPAWGLVTRLAKLEHNKAWSHLVLQFGFSISGPAYFQIGFWNNTLSSTAGLTEIMPLERARGELGDTFLNDVGPRLDAVNSTLDTLQSNPEGLLDFVHTEAGQN